MDDGRRRGEREEEDRGEGVAQHSRHSFNWKKPKDFSGSHPNLWEHWIIENRSWCEKMVSSLLHFRNTNSRGSVPEGDIRGMASL